MSQALFTTQGFSQQGFSQQGFSQQGTSLVAAHDLQGFSLSSLRLPGETAPGVFSNLLEEGQLVAYRSTLSATSPSLGRCDPRTVTTGLTRACGWGFQGLGSCSRGQTMTVGPGACYASVGATMLRVCAGSASCEHASATVLKEAVGTAGLFNINGNGTCPVATFTCPAGGVFNVLTGPVVLHWPGSMTVVGTASTPFKFPYYNVRRAGTALKESTVSAYLVDGGTVGFSIGQILPELKDRIVPYPGSDYAGTTARYELIGPLADGGTADVCGDDALDYPEQGGVSNDAGTAFPVALPVSGWWDTTGAVHREDPDRFTFSCRPGVVSKCYRWGYRPWQSGLYHDKEYLPPGQLENLHQTCTRMARADYCGNGLSYTVLGTNIDLWDNNAPQIQLRGSLETEKKMGLSFEAGWSPDGATCLNHVRWSFAPPEVLNPETCQVLHNPKKHDAPEVCDTQAQAEAIGAQYRPPSVFNSSAYNSWDGGTPWYALDAGA